MSPHASLDEKQLAIGKLQTSAFLGLPLDCACVVICSNFLLCTFPSETERQLDMYSRKGLRTLVVASKELSEADADAIITRLQTVSAVECYCSILGCQKAQLGYKSKIFMSFPFFLIRPAKTWKTASRNWTKSMKSWKAI